MHVLDARPTRLSLSSVISHSTSPTVRPYLTTRPTARKRAFQIGFKPRWEPDHLEELTGGVKPRTTEPTEQLLCALSTSQSHRQPQKK